MEKIKLIERVDALIRRKGTGSPPDLARRLQLSERSLFNLINVMKDMEAPIYYCSDRCSYCYEADVEFVIGFVPTNTIRGGKSHIYLEKISDCKFFAVTPPILSSKTFSRDILRTL